MLGIPLMLLELSLGQHRQQGFVRCMTEIHVGFSGLAWATVINSFLSCTFYNVIMAWSLVYLVNSFSLPWAAPAAPAAAAAGCGCSALSTTCRCGERSSRSGEIAADQGRAYLCCEISSM